MNQIENELRKALLLNGEMSYELFEYELKEHIDYWKKGVKQDKEEFMFAVTQNNRDVAMLLITNKEELFVNEKAREQLYKFWNIKNAYKNNIEYLLPFMVEELENGVIPVNGVKTIK